MRQSWFPEVTGEMLGAPTFHEGSDVLLGPPDLRG